jgi:hypothetical protein
MRHIRQALRLHLEAGLSYGQIARAVGIGKGTVGKFIVLARAAGVDWAVAQTLSDEQLEARLYRPAHEIVASAARPASTPLFLHLKHLGEAGACPVGFDAWATTSAWNCAIARAGPLVGPIAPAASRKCRRSVMYIAALISVNT